MSEDERGLGSPRGPQFRSPEFRAPVRPTEPAGPPPDDPSMRRFWITAAALVGGVLAGGLLIVAWVVLHDPREAAVGYSQAFPTTTPTPTPPASDPLVDAIRAAQRGVVAVVGARASGSGMIYDGQGHVLTNQHLLAGGGPVRVVGSDGRRHPAVVVGQDARRDLAVLQISPGSGDPLPLGSSADVRVGDPVAAVGAPSGRSATTTAGKIGAVEELVTIGRLQQTAVATDAKVFAGNTGGPLINEKGEVVGLSTTQAKGPSSGSGGAAGAEGVSPGASGQASYAIPVDRAAAIADKLIGG